MVVIKHVHPSGIKLNKYSYVVDVNLLCDLKHFDWLTINSTMLLYVISHIQRIIGCQPEKTTLHGG